MHPLKKRKGPVRVDKVCIYCGHLAKQVTSGTVNCKMCWKRGLRTAYGTMDNGEPYIPEND